MKGLAACWSAACRVIAFLPASATALGRSIGGTTWCLTHGLAGWDPDTIDGYLAVPGVCYLGASVLVDLV